MKEIDSIKLLEALDKKIEWHRKNQNDPHGIGNAVIAILSEIKDAIYTSTYGFPDLDGPAIPARTEFGNELGFALNILNISQASLAKKLKVSRSAVTQYMQQENIGLETMQKIASEIGCEVRLKLSPMRRPVKD